MLRFDVETISKATAVEMKLADGVLRFDVETISKATTRYPNETCLSCGLM